MSRAIDTLEAHHGVAHLRRATRALSVTDSGHSYLEMCRRVLSEIDDADRAISGTAESPRGRIRVTAPVQFGRLHIGPIVLEFLQKHPDVGISLVLLDRPVNLVEEGFDLALRIGNLEDSAMTAIRVGEVRRVVCASPD